MKSSPFPLYFPFLPFSYRENSPLVPGHYDQSTIETKEEDPANDTQGTHESVNDKRNPRASVSKSYLPDVPLGKETKAPKM